VKFVVMTAVTVDMPGMTLDEFLELNDKDTKILETVVATDATLALAQRPQFAPDRVKIVAKHESYVIPV